LNKLFFKMSALIDESAIFYYFSSFGKVELVEVKYNYLTGEARDIGFVVFQRAESAQSVIAQGARHYVANVRLLVQPSKSIKQSAVEEKANTNKLWESKKPHGFMDGSRNGRIKEHLMPGFNPSISHMMVTQSTRLLSETHLCDCEEKINNLISNPQKNFQEEDTTILMKNDNRNCGKPTFKNWTHFLIEENHIRSGNIKLRVLKPSNHLSTVS